MKSVSMIFLSGLILWGCGSGSKREESKEYKTMTLRCDSQTLFTSYTARLEGCRVVELRPQVSGTIRRIGVEEGSKVRKGQVLFVVDPIPYQEALAVAEANVEAAKVKLSQSGLTLESTRKLREKNVVKDYDLASAENDYASAKAALQLARAQERSARNDLSYTEVKSPVDGVAGMIGFREGALVSSNISQPLLTVSDDSRIYAYFSLSESQVLELIDRYGSLDDFLKQMPDVQLRLASGKVYAHAGRIAAVSGLVSDGTGAVSLRADFPNPEGVLRNGGSGSVIVPTVLTDCLVIPQGATYELQNRTFVYRVVDGKAQSAPVEVYRLNNGNEYVVEHGLKAGDVIIAEGAGLVSEGTAVKPVDKSQAVKKQKN